LTCPCLCVIVDRGESMPDPERVAIYCRVSTDEQAERQTIENQLDACRGYCASHELEVVAEFRDEGVSGSVPLGDRLEGSRLLAMAGSGLFSRVAVHRLDRLARDHVEASLAYRRLKALGAPVVSVTETFDDSPAGRLMFNMIVSFAEFEKDLIRERTMMGRLRRVKGGKYQASRAPYGYTYNQEAGQLEPHLENAVIVRLMYEWACEGAGLKIIALRLEEKGIPPPSAAYAKGRSAWGWHLTTVHKILTAPRYIGKSTYGGEPMTCPALVDEEIFVAVQHGLKQRKRDSPRNTQHFYLLQHLVYCRHCGGRYVARTVIHKNGPVTIYACRQRTVYGPKAGHVGIHWRWHGSELEAPVKHYILRAWADPDYVEREVDAWREQWERSVLEQGDREAATQARWDQLDQEELRVLEWARKGYIDEWQMLLQVGAVRTARDNLVDELAQPPADENPTPMRLRLMYGFVKSLKSFRQYLRSISQEDTWAEYLEATLSSLRAPPDVIGEALRVSIQALIERIWVEDDGLVTIEGAIPSLPAGEGT